MRWPDFGLPLRRGQADAAIREAWTRAGAERVAVMCAHGRGRTGAVLAVLAALAGVPPQEAVAWARRAYRPDAVDAPWQRWWVRRTARRLAA